MNAAPSTPKYRVLVVDDAHDHADVLAEFFAAAGHEARVAHNGELALSVVNEFQPQCVMFDVHMPSMGGHELAQMLRTYFTDDLVLIGMSGYSSEDSSVAAAFSLVDYRFQKPVDFERLAQVLNGMRAGVAATVRG